MSLSSHKLCGPSNTFIAYRESSLTSGLGSLGCISSESSSEVIEQESATAGSAVAICGASAKDDDVDEDDELERSSRRALIGHALEDDARVVVEVGRGREFFGSGSSNSDELEDSSSDSNSRSALIGVGSVSGLLEDSDLAELFIERE